MPTHGHTHADAHARWGMGCSGLSVSWVTCVGSCSRVSSTAVSAWLQGRGDQSMGCVRVPWLTAGFELKT
eukprot:245764-Prymnesium_polylepis.2